MTSGDVYPEIADHGVIGDLRSAALVAADGTIDFLCLPEFDSPTVFAGLLDAEHGGHFVIAPSGANSRGEQRYLRDTNVLVTRFTAEDGVFELIDFMAMGNRRRNHAIVRLVRAVKGAPRVRVHCAPRFDYARRTHHVERTTKGVVFTTSDGSIFSITADVPLVADELDVRAEIVLAGRKPVAFVLEQLDGKRARRPMDYRAAGRSLRQTVVYWRRWISRCTYRGEWRAAVRRSALTLKLLQSDRTGGIIAAPTFGLPEQIGGSRNWDFRYAWVRDASYTVYALVRVGLATEARGFTEWIARRCDEAPSPGTLQSLYGIDGRRVLTETTLDHLDGYRGSRPVRIGNAAYDQLQLDIYGELIDTLYIADAHGMRLSRRTWGRIADAANWVCANWERADQGIWEVRSGAKEFLFSRLMCWVALDRAVRLARRHRFSSAPHEWRTTRDAIRADIEQHFWSEQIGAFVGSRESASVDASCLVMPLVRFIDASDPRWRSTLRVVEERLVRDWLVRRYDMDGMDTEAGSPTAPAFTILSFWYIECLARAGLADRASEGMRRLLAHANHVGLFSEDLTVDGKQVGNFPQGLVHAALIGAAMALAPHLNSPAR